MATRRGFTDHEHLDEVELIHMNGRIYDYNIGRFLSVDPFIQGTGSQGINPYSYVLNNPLSFTDPTGYSALNNDGSICDGDLTGYCQTRSFEVQGTSSESSKATQNEETSDNGATNYLTSEEQELLELGGMANTALKKSNYSVVEKTFLSTTKSSERNRIKENFENAKKDPNVVNAIEIAEKELLIQLRQNYSDNERVGVMIYVDKDNNIQIGQPNLDVPNGSDHGLGGLWPIEMVSTVRPIKNNPKNFQPVVAIVSTASPLKGEALKNTSVADWYHDTSHRTGVAVIIIDKQKLGINRFISFGNGELEPYDE